VHFITEIMELYQPYRSTRSFQFREDPLILESSKNVGRYEFVDHNLLEILRWEGPEELIYVKSSAADDNAWGDDYITLDESFTFEYDMPKIMPGRYLVEIRCDAYGQDNATIQVRIDDKRMGGNIDLTSGGNSINSFAWFGIGIIEIAIFVVLLDIPFKCFIRRKKKSKAISMWIVGIQCVIKPGGLNHLPEF